MTDITMGPAAMTVLRTTPRLLATLLLAVGLASCGESTAPGGGTRPPAQLRIIELAVNAPPLEADSVSFVATKGQGAEQRINFLLPGGEREEYLRFTLDGASLLARPDGTPIANGDTVHITLKVVDPRKVLFEFRPEGLKFDPAHPAKLRIDYGEANKDYNQDGIEGDAGDQVAENQFAIWRQPRVGDDFIQLGSFLSKDLEEIEAELTGFSRYAIAY